MIKQIALAIMEFIKEKFPETTTKYNEKTTTISISTKEKIIALIDLDEQVECRKYEPGLKWHIVDACKYDYSEPQLLQHIENYIKRIITNPYRPTNHINEHR